MLERSFVEDGKRDVKLDEYFKQSLRRAGYVECQVQKTPVAMRIVLKVERPGLVIGRKGSAIEKMTRELETKFK